jgi:hypothetical protein
MKRSILVTVFVAATFWIATTPVFSQHGRPASPGAAAPSTRGSSTSAGGDHASSSQTTSPSSPSSVLSRNSNLSGALTKALANSGINVTDLKSTCGPFKNLGQCIAALHINHKFPSCTLADLSSAKSLGAGIQGCNPQADAKAEARSATKQAKQDIKDSNS